MKWYEWAHCVHCKRHFRYARSKSGAFWRGRFGSPFFCFACKGTPKKADYFDTYEFNGYGYVKVEASR